MAEGALERIERHPLKRRLYAILESSEEGPEQKRVERALLALILLNVAAVAVLTVPSASLDPLFGTLALALYSATLFLFVAEYWARLWVCTENPRYARPFAGRLRFALRPIMLLDLAAISPLAVRFLLGFTGPAEALSLIMLLRLFKVFRFAPSMRTLARVVRSRRQELGLTLAAIGIALVAASTVEYVLENGAQPDKFASVPAAMYWGIVTLTTVGYGDVTPVTPGGRAVAGFVALLGIALIALPAGILSSGFAEEFARGRRDPSRCPHCGEPL